MFAAARKFASIAVVLAATAFPGTLYAQASPLIVAPPMPHAQQKVVVSVPRGAIGYPTVVAQYQGGSLESFAPQATRVSMAGNKITISVEMSGGIQMIGFSPSPPHDVELGPLPAGSYQVEMVRRLPDGAPFGSVGTASFTVASRSQSDPLWNHTDLWWDPSESGWGLSLVQHASGVIFATWFVYAADGSPTWYVVPEGRWETPTEYRGPVYRTTGPTMVGCGPPPQAECPPFNTNAVVPQLAGSAAFTFDEFDVDSARISFTIDGATVRRSVRRFSAGAKAGPLAVVPSSPRMGETLRLQVPTGVIAYDPKKTRVTMSGNRIEVSAEIAEGTASAPMDLPLGQLPEGDYEIVLSQRRSDGSAAGTAGTATFKVSPRAEAGPRWDLTDLWWDPAESGWGLSVIRHAADKVFLIWYAYGPDGKPVWYVMPDGQWGTPHPIYYSGPLYRTTGPAFGACTSSSCPPFDPNAVGVTRVGAAAIFMNGPDDGRVHFNIEGHKLIVKVMRRAPF